VTLQHGERMEGFRQESMFGSVGPLPNLEGTKEMRPSGLMVPLLSMKLTQIGEGKS
jgi:hypothetical protein